MAKWLTFHFNKEGGGCQFTTLNFIPIYNDFYFSILIEQLRIAKWLAFYFNKVGGSARIVVQVLPRDLRIYDWLIVVLVLWNCLYIVACVNWYTFTVIMKVFRKFRDRNIVLPMPPFVSGRTCDLLRTTCGKGCCVFLVNYQPMN